MSFELKLVAAVVYLEDDVLDQLAARVADRVVSTPRPWLDVAGAAEHLACPTSRIYSLAAADRIPVHRDGSRLLPPP